MRDAKARLAGAGRLHAAMGRGTASLSFEVDQTPEPATLIELLHFAWKQTAVQRIQFATPMQRERQLTVI